MKYERVNVRMSIETNVDLKRAKSFLNNLGYTCVLMKGNQAYTSNQSGIEPLMCWIEDGIDFNEYSAADKAIGKAAAYLYVKMGVTEVYAGIISQPALDVLNGKDIPVTYEELVPAIPDSADTGFFSMESAVLDIDNVQEAYEVLKEKIAQTNR